MRHPKDFVLRDRSQAKSTLLMIAWRMGLVGL